METYTITPKQAQGIIDRASSLLKKRLARIWAEEIVLGEKIEIADIAKKMLYKSLGENDKNFLDDIFLQGKSDIKIMYNNLHLSDIRCKNKDAYQCIINALEKEFGPDRLANVCMDGEIKIKIKRR